MKRGDRETRGPEMEIGDREDDGTGDGDRGQEMEIGNRGGKGT